MAHFCCRQHKRSITTVVCGDRAVCRGWRHCASGCRTESGHGIRRFAIATRRCVGLDRGCSAFRGSSSFCKREVCNGSAMRPFGSLLAQRLRARAISIPASIVLASTRGKCRRIPVQARFNALSARKLPYQRASRQLAQGFLAGYHKRMAVSVQQDGGNLLVIQRQSFAGFLHVIAADVGQHVLVAAQSLQPVGHFLTGIAALAECHGAQCVEPQCGRQKGVQRVVGQPRVAGINGAQRDGRRGPAARVCCLLLQGTGCSHPGRT